MERLKLDSLKIAYENRARMLSHDEETKLEEIRSQYKERRNIAYDEYRSQASAEILNSLKNDYEILQERSILPMMDISEKEMKAAVKIYEALEEAGLAKDETAILRGIGRFLGKNISVRKIRKTVKAISLGNLEQREVFSYMSFSPDKCYLISPTDGKNNESLSRNLEEKISTILEQGRVLSSVKQELQEYLQFAADLGFKKGFLFFMITSKDDYEKLSESLKSKLEELQPDEFKKASLIHRIERIDFEIMDYLISKSERTIQREKARVSPYERIKHEEKKEYSFDEAAEILGLSLKGIRRNLTMGKLQGTEDSVYTDSMIKYLEKGKRFTASGRKRLDFETDDIEERRKIVLADANKCNDILYSKEITKVLRVSPGAINYLKEHIAHDFEGRKLIFYKDSLIDFINHRRPTNKGWIK